MKLEEVVTIKVGQNISRIYEKNDRALETYTYDDLVDDLNGLYLDGKSDNPLINSINHDANLSRGGEVVFSFVSSKATIVSNQNIGKIINQNFAKLVIEDDQLEASYLCYVLNESHDMKKQMAISMQGSTVPKLTPSILKALDVTLPSLDKQIIIGEAYLTIKKQRALAIKQAELEEQLYLEVLKKIDQQ